MNDANAIARVRDGEGRTDWTPAEIAAWQHILNVRLYRSQAGWFGREVFRLVKAGVIHIPAGWNDVFRDSQGAQR